MALLSVEVYSNTFSPTLMLVEKALLTNVCCLLACIILYTLHYNIIIGIDVGVVEAFDKAWELDKPFQTQNYFR